MKNELNKLQKQETSDQRHHFRYRYRHHNALVVCLLYTVMQTPSDERKEPPWHILRAMHRGVRWNIKVNKH